MAMFAPRRVPPCLTCSVAVLKIFMILNAALKQAVKLGIIPRNPADALERPKPQRKEMKVWDENQVITFISTLEQLSSKLENR